MSHSAPCCVCRLSALAAQVAGRGLSRARDARDGAAAACSKDGKAKSMAERAPGKRVNQREASWVVGGGDEGGVLLQAVEVGGACKVRSLCSFGGASA